MTRINIFALVATAFAALTSFTVLAQQDDEEAGARLEGQEAAPRLEGQEAAPRLEGKEAAPRLEGQEAAPRLERRLVPSNVKVFTLDRIVAVINEEIITLQELNARMNVVVQQLNKQGTQLPQRQILARQVLDRMISDQVQFQLAKETGLRIEDDMLDRAMQRIAEDNKMTPPEFRDALERDGIRYEAFRDDVRSEMLLARLREREVDTKVNVNESEIDAQLEQDAKRAAPDEEYLVAHILVQIPDQASAEQIEARRKRAEQALESVKSGEDFARISASFSDAPEALQGGNLGWRAASRLPNLFVEALEKLSTGALSPLLKSANGFHILKLLDKRGRDVPQNITQAKTRHILVKVNEVVSDEDAKQRILQIKDRLDNGANFADVAKQASEDASAPTGGELGWVSPGDTLPEFESVVMELETGQISAPVRTAFGWHLVQVLERRTQDVSKERTRMTARLGVRQRKADEAFQDWLRQLRDRAYIEYRLEEQ